MNFRSLLLGATLMLGTQAGPHLRQEQPRQLMAMAFEEYHSYLFSTINAFRANHSLPALCHHDSLMASANTTVNMVAFAGLLNGGGSSRDSRVRSNGFSGASVDELWAADGYEGSDKGSAASVFKQWKATPDAYDKLLGNFTSCGSGKALGSDGTVFYVMHLGKDEGPNACTTR